MKKQKSGRRRRQILYTVALIFIPGVFAYREFFLARPMGEGPAGPSVDATHFQGVWTDQPVQLVGIGDSITAGLGAKSPRHTFFNRLIRNPRDEYEDMAGIALSGVIPKLSTENFAISGSDSMTHLEVIRDTIPQYPEAFGIVVMTTGGNDLIHSYGRSAPRECAMYSATLEQAQPWIDSFGVRLGKMIELITEKFPLGCEIFLADIYDPTDGVGDAPSVFLPDWPDGLEIHARYNAVIRRVAASNDHVHVVPLHQHFLGHGSHCRQFWRSNYDRSDPHYWYFTNIEDPNDRGYDAIRRIFLNSIIRNTRLMAQNHRDDSATDPTYP